jgi:hypothetical protein
VPQPTAPPRAMIYSIIKQYCKAISVSENVPTCLKPNVKLELAELPNPHHEHKAGCTITHTRRIKTQAYLHIVQ